MITSRDGASETAAIEHRARDAFSQPTVRFGVVGEEPAGFALTVEQDRQVALLSRVCVEPATTSRGLGTALVIDAIQHARKAAFERINLDVRQTNSRAIALYKRLGFTATLKPWIYDGGDPMLTFSLELWLVT